MTEKSKKAEQASTTIRDRIRELRRVRASDLLPNEHNWRKHPRKQERFLAGVLEEIGYADALLCYETEAGLKLIDGHLRQKLTPDQEVPVLILDVNEEEADKLLLTFDPIAQFAEAEREKLQSAIDRVRARNEGVQELVAKIASNHNLVAPQTKPKNGKIGDDQIPEPPAEPVSKQGDLYRLGDHWLYCGDCKNPKSVEAVMRGEKPLLVISDPPYCSGGFQEAGKKAGTWGEIASDNLSTRGYKALITGMLEAARPQTAYLFTDWRMWVPLLDVVESCGIACRNMLVWDKKHPGLGSTVWRQQHELIMFASRAGGKKTSWKGGQGNVITCSRTRNEHHYTEKPVELLMTFMKQDERSEREKCPILDPFVGSGSTIIAAEKIGRSCRAIEIEPKFVDVCVRRWEEFTGEKAEKVEA